MVGLEIDTNSRVSDCCINVMLASASIRRPNEATGVRVQRVQQRPWYGTKAFYGDAQHSEPPQVAMTHQHPSQASSSWGEGGNTSISHIPPVN